MDGETAVNPYRLRKRTACDYCSYRGICGFDEKKPGYEYRSLPVFQDQVLWQRMSDEERKADGEDRSKVEGKEG